MPDAVTWSRAWKVVAGAMAFVAAVATIVDRGDRLVIVVAWLYPLGVIVILVAVVFGFAVRRFVSRRRPYRYRSDEEREFDGNVVRQVRERVTRRDVTLLRNHDFAASWRAGMIDPLSALVADMEHAEHVPFHPQLRRTLIALLDKTGRFVAYYGLNTFPEQGAGSEWQNIGIRDTGFGTDPFTGQHTTWAERCAWLNDAADEIGSAYDQFIIVARDALLLDAPDPAN